MKCEDCRWLRTDVKIKEGNPTMPKRFGEYFRACNRFPQNILRGPEEPACGEFKEKGAKDNETNPSAN